MKYAEKELCCKSSGDDVVVNEEVSHASKVGVSLADCPSRRAQMPTS